MQSSRAGHRPEANEQESPQAPDRCAEILRLRLVPKRKKKAVRWAEDVVDNELLNKKSSKQCCIFHKQRQFGDWDGDDSDDEPCYNPDDAGQPDADTAAQ